jgi:hypothetical protein
MNFKEKFFLLIISLSIPIFTFAQNASVNIGTLAVPFLRIPPDARAGGMGETGIATAPDANSPFWNIAKVPFAEDNSGISLNYNPWLRSISKDVYLGTLSGYMKLKNGQALSSSLRYFSLGDIPFTDLQGKPLESYQPREFAFDIGYSKKLSERLALGIAFRYINSNLASATQDQNYKAGNAVAADISLYYSGLDNTGQGFSYGFTASNLGSKIGYTNNSSENEFIPANLGIGASYTSVLDEKSKLGFALDLNKLLVPDISFTGNAQLDSANVNRYHGYSVLESWFKPNKSYSGSLGMEYGYNEEFFLRTGFYYESRSSGNRNYLTTGLGIKYENFGFNFSYLIPTSKITNGLNPLANTLRLNLVFNLHKAEIKSETK